MTPRPGYDPGSLVAGILVLCLGAVLLADQAEVIDLGWPYVLPLVLGAVGGILLACGLAGPPRGGPRP